MSAIVLSPSEVRRLLPMRECIELMAEVFKDLARGEAVNPLRSVVRLPKGLGLLGMMPGYMPSTGALGLKAIAVFPGNHGTEYDAHQGVVLLFDPEHGLPSAIVDASEITAIRTAAATAVATMALAREDSEDLAILGSGVQARAHLEAMSIARKIRRVRVYSPTRERRESFARHEAERYGIDVEARSSARDAVDGADIICTTTTAKEPILQGSWLAPGAHVNAVGSSIADARELDTAAVVRSRLFVDRRESTVNEAGDFLFPKKEGAIDDDHIAGEIGEVLLGQRSGRESADEVTLFKSLGLAVEDLAAAHYVLRRARAEGSGTTVDLGGYRHAAD